MVCLFVFFSFTGQIPLGFAFEAKDFSEKTHRLPCPPRAIGETDFARIFERTLEILATGNDDEHKGKPMVFVLEGVNNENVRMVRSFFQQFSDDYEKIDVLPLTRLFLELKLKAAKNGKENVVNTIHVARLFMERNPFSFSREISCSVSALLLLYLIKHSDKHSILYVNCCDYFLIVPL